MPGGQDHASSRWWRWRSSTTSIPLVQPQTVSPCMTRSRPKGHAREGVSRAAELAVVGTAEAVTRQLTTYIATGATGVVLEPLQTGLTDLRRVWEMAAAF